MVIHDHLPFIVWLFIHMVCYEIRDCLYNYHSDRALSILWVATWWVEDTCIVFKHNWVPSRVCLVHVTLYMCTLPWQQDFYPSELLVGYWLHTTDRLHIHTTCGCGCTMTSMIRLSPNLCECLLNGYVCCLGHRTGSVLGLWPHMFVCLTNYTR